MKRCFSAETIVSPTNEEASAQTNGISFAMISREGLGTLQPLNSFFFFEENFHIHSAVYRDVFCKVIGLFRNGYKSALDSRNALRKIFSKLKSFHLRQTSGHRSEVYKSTIFSTFLTFGSNQVDCVFKTFE